MLNHRTDPVRDEDVMSNGCPGVAGHLNVIVLIVNLIHLVVDLAFKPDLGAPITGLSVPLRGGCCGVVRLCLLDFGDNL
jgi:hypothetical protein